jgi:hypothetical protein
VRLQHDSLSESCAELIKALLDGRGPEVVETTYEKVDKVIWDKIGLVDLTNLMC